MFGAGVSIGLLFVVRMMPLPSIGLPRGSTTRPSIPRPTGTETVADGMPLRIASQEFYLASTGTDDYGRTFGVAEVALPDGVYDGTVVVEQTRPIDFLLESR